MRVASRKSGCQRYVGETLSMAFLNSCVRNYTKADSSMSNDIWRRVTPPPPPRFALFGYKKLKSFVTYFFRECLVEYFLVVQAVARV